jgi:signal transduction histidine kinase
MEQTACKENSQDPGELLCSVLTHEMANSLHDICSVINVVQEHMHRNGHVDQPTDASLRLVTDEINRLVLMLQDFRSSRLFSLNLEPTSLARVVHDCLALESANAVQRGIRIACDIPSNLPRILADRAKLKQVFLNLYKNAVEAMPEGGVFTVKALALEQTVCVSLSDTGLGIPEGVPIFEPFVTDKPNGTGLGLAIVKWIVMAHGGEIGYSSKPGEGTVFHLVFNRVGASKTRPSDSRQ